MEAPGVRPFRIEVAPELLSDLKRRLGGTRRPTLTAARGWEAGTDPAFLQDLVGYWLVEYNWRRHEALLNRLTRFKATVRGHELHFIHERGQGPNPFPLLLTHGYPDSSYRFTKLIPMLTNPEAHGGQPEDAFDVIAPDIPGFGFSPPPPELPAERSHVADLWAELMSGVLGYERFGAHGSGRGAAITERLAQTHSHAVAAIHLTEVPRAHLRESFEDLSSAEKKFFRRLGQSRHDESGVGLAPATLAAALSDSPAGLAAWIVERFQRWSDGDGDIEESFTKDELLTNVMIYWVTNCIGTALDSGDAGTSAPVRRKPQRPKARKDARVPAAFALFPKDVAPPPRAWAERFFDVQRWTPMPRGGHFAALEAPELLVEDLRAWFRPFRTSAPAPSVSNQPSRRRSHVETAAARRVR